jgi:hypothetical protein
MMKKDFGAATRRLREAEGELSHATDGERRANVEAAQVYPWIAHIRRSA